MSFSFVREQLKDSYSETGRPSIDPELLLRILLIGYLYGITSERKLVEELVCIWPGAGSPVSASIRRFHITPRSPRTGTGGFRNRNRSSSCSNRERRVSAWLLDRDIMPYMRTRDSALRKKNPGYGPERFTYQPESNSYHCPAGESLSYVGLNVRNRAYAYIGSAKRCGACFLKAQCTTGRYKYLAIHIHESARQRARELANTPEFSTAQRQRKKVEALFAELKNQIGLRRLRSCACDG